MQGGKRYDLFHPKPEKQHTTPPGTQFFVRPELILKDFSDTLLDTTYHFLSLQRGNRKTMQAQPVRESYTATAPSDLS